MLPNYGLHSACDQVDGFLPSKKCQSGNNPKILVWGDSFAMLIVPALNASGVAPFIQATKFQCAPVLDLAQVSSNDFISEVWARDCITFNRTVVDYSLSNPEIETVILSSSFLRYLAKSRRALR